MTQASHDFDARAFRWTEVMGRLKPGASAQQGRRQVAAVAGRLEQQKR